MEKYTEVTKIAGKLEVITAHIGFAAGRAGSFTFTRFQCTSAYAHLEFCQILKPLKMPQK